MDRPGTSTSSGARRHGSGRTLSSPGEKRPRAFRGFGGDCMVDFRSILFPRLTFEPHCCPLYIRLVSVHLIVIILNRRIVTHNVQYRTVDKKIHTSPPIFPPYPRSLLLSPCFPHFPFSYFFFLSRNSLVMDAAFARLRIRHRRPWQVKWGLGGKRCSLDFSTA